MISLSAATVSPSGMAPRDPPPAQLHMPTREDTAVYGGCEYGANANGEVANRPFHVLDTGRAGPDDVRIVIHENGDVTVTVNGVEYRYAADDAMQDSFVRVRVDQGDTVHVEDRRGMADKMMNPRPVQVFEFP